MPQLIDVYIKQVRSVLELAVPVWHSNLTQHDRNNIERVQKCALAAILGDSYHSYDYALKVTNLKTLEDRRQQLCLNFAKKVESNHKHNWFKETSKGRVTRLKPEKYCDVHARTVRFEKSPISYLTQLLNSYHKQ